MGDEIRPCPSYPDYGVTANGVAYRMTKSPTNSKPVPYPVRMVKDSRCGYPTASIMRNRKQTAAYVHIMILDAFVGPRPDGMQACHNDGNHENCTLSNLRWDTRSANALDKRRHGTSCAGERHCNAVFSRGDVEWIRAYPKKRGMFNRMSERLQVSRYAVHAAYYGKTWSHL